MAITEDILVRLRVQGQQQFAGAMGGAATQTGRLGTAAGTAGKQVDATGSKAKRAAGKVSSFGKSVGGMAIAAGSLVAVQRVVKDSIGNAVDLGEQINKTAVVFRGPGAKSIQQWSKTTATALGISRRQALESAGTLGNMLVPMGIGRQKAADMSKSFVTLAADMASFNNATPEETLDALRSGLAGETEPLRKFGVFLNDARVKQQAMKMGLYDGTGQLDAQAKALATTAIITKDTKDAQGDFGRTSDSLANQQRILSARYEEATAWLGGKLIPVLSFLAKHMDIVLPIVGAVALAMLGLAAAAAVAWIAVLGPVELIIIGIAALAAGIFIAYRKFKIVRTVVDAVWGVLKALVKWVIGALPEVWAILKNAPLIWLIRNFGKIKNAAVAAFNWVKRAATNAWNWVKTAAGNAVSFVKSKFNSVVSFFRNLPGKIKSAASGMWDGIKEAFRSVINTIIGWWNGLEFSVPGIDKGPIHIGGFSLGTPDIGKLAAGGPALAGSPYIVGEQGPELFVPSQAGTVLPNGGGAIHTHVYLNGREIATAVGNAAADRKARR